jgi:hypothetical protein
LILLNTRDGGTALTHLCRAGLTDAQIADITAWSLQNVGDIRQAYVDDAAVIVAIGQRLSTAMVENGLIKTLPKPQLD